MPLAEDIVTSRHRLTSYSDQTVSINEAVYRESLVLTADWLHSPWPVQSLADLDDATLQPLFDTQPVVVLLGSMIPIGSALQSTGGTALIAGSIVTATAGLSPVIVLTVLMVVTMTLSDVLNNTATTVIAAPIALQTAAISSSA